MFLFAEMKWTNWFQRHQQFQFQRRKRVKVKIASEILVDHLQMKLPAPTPPKQDESWMPLTFASDLLQGFFGKGLSSREALGTGSPWKGTDVHVAVARWTMPSSVDVTLAGRGGGQRVLLRLTVQMHLRRNKGCALTSLLIMNYTSTKVLNNSWWGQHLHVKLLGHSFNADKSPVNHPPVDQYFP